MTFLKWCLRAILLGLTLAALGSAWIYHQVTEPLPIDEPLTFEVKAGDTSYQLGNRLYQQGLIVSPWLLRISAKLQPEWVPKVGKYALQKEMNLIQVMALVDSGKAIFHSVTLLEGNTTQDFIATLAATGKITMTLTGLTNQQIAEQLDLPYGNAEGLFFANTYRYHEGDSDEQILRRANALLNQQLQQSWQQKAQDLPYKSAYDALIMASIVEKETAAPEERPLIARVFISRLEKNMRLQTDPTVIYGLGDKYNGNLTRKSLRDDSPYNTYRVYGLPPTPIANVGKEAIVAALQPGQTKALYFVAKGDGTHAFSNTLREHNAAVKAYQYKRRADYRSTPKAD